MKTLLIAAQFVSVSSLIVFLMVSETLPGDIRWVLVLMMLFAMLLVFASVIWYLNSEQNDFSQSRGVTMLSRQEMLRMASLMAREKTRLR